MLVRVPASCRFRAPLVLGVLGLALWGGCRRSSDPEANTGRGAGRPDQLAMRDPDALGRPPASGRPLGELDRARPDTPDPTADPTSKTRSAPTRLSPPPLIRVADGERSTPYPISDGALKLPGGLVVHRVPAKVSVRQTREAGTGDKVWEIVDARGRRLALIKARSWTRAAGSEASLLESADVRTEVRPAVWGKTQVRVVTDRFHNDTHIYTLDRRQNGTDWIWSGIDLSQRSTGNGR